MTDRIEQSEPEIAGFIDDEIGSADASERFGIGRSGEVEEVE